MEGYMTCCHRNFNQKKEKKTKLATKNKGTRRKNDSIYGQYTNVCKLGAN